MRWPRYWIDRVWLGKDEANELSGLSREDEQFRRRMLRHNFPEEFIKLALCFDREQREKIFAHLELHSRRVKEWMDLQEAAVRSIAACNSLEERLSVLQVELDSCAADQRQVVAELVDKAKAELVEARTEADRKRDLVARARDDIGPSWPPDL